MTGGVPVGLAEFVAKPLGVAGPVGSQLPGQPRLPCCGVGGNIFEPVLIEREPLEELRFVRGTRLHHPVEIGSDVEHHVGPQRVGTGEAVVHRGHDRVAAQDRHVGTDRRDRHQVAGILHGLANRPMIGMVVAGAVSQHEIGAELSQFADHLLTQGQAGLEAPVGEGPDLGSGSQQGGGAGGFGRAEGGQRGAAQAEMPGRTIGRRDQLHHMPGLGVPPHQSAGVELGIVGVGSEDQQPQWLRAHTCSCPHNSSTRLTGHPCRGLPDERSPAYQRMSAHSARCLRRRIPAPQRSRSDSGQ